MDKRVIRMRKMRDTLNEISDVLDGKARHQLNHMLEKIVDILIKNNLLEWKKEPLNHNYDTLTKVKE